MAEQSYQERTRTSNQPQTEGSELRGGTQGPEAPESIDFNVRGGGTPGIASPAGGVHVEPPSEYVPRTGLEERATEYHRLAGGRTPEEILGYVRGTDFPAKKDTLVRLARRNGAPPDVLGAMNVLGSTEYATADDLLRDYPRLPNRDDFGTPQGRM